MKLIINQQLENGCLGGPKHVLLSVESENEIYQISIEQALKRKITIESSGETDIQKLLGIYFNLSTLLMIFDGQFLSVDSVYENEVEITQSWKKRTLPCYVSGDFLRGAGNILIGFEQVLTEQLYYDWCQLRKELDLIHIASAIPHMNII